MSWPHLYLVPIDELDDLEAAIVEAINAAMGPMPFEDNDHCRQGVLFSGLDCLPGQQDLFPTDGGADESHCHDQDRST
jgi:hypothetical protein